MPSYLPDTKDLAVRRLILANLVDMQHEVMKHPQFRVIGRQWYPTAGQFVAGANQRVFGNAPPHPLTSYGITAAMSPALDWEHNKHAVDTLAKITDTQWDTIYEDVASEGGRSEDVSKITADTPLAGAPSSHLVKAHQILRGVDPNSILQRKKMPKTHSFMYNLARGGGIEIPEAAHHYVTIDYRANDVAMNRMMSVRGTGRGIESAMSARGPTRYEDLQDLHNEAANVLNEHYGFKLNHEDVVRRALLGADVQAGGWVMAKAIESSSERFPLKSGRPRQKGVERRGQRYLLDRPDVIAAAAASPERSEEAAPTLLLLGRQTRQSRQAR